MKDNSAISPTAHLLRPFGPPIGFFQLPENLTDILMEITDQIIASDNKISHGASLAGQIEEEPLIPEQILKEAGLDKYFKHCAKAYTIQTYNDPIPGAVVPTQKFEDIKIDLGPVWVISQYEGEYNPLHYHRNCTLSAVLYLKKPDKKPRNIPNKADLDGFIQWSYHSVVPDTFELGTFTTEPEVGSLFIWPSHLMHTVYPFLGAGERRSVSFNATHTLTY